VQSTGFAWRSVTHPAWAGCAPSLPRLAITRSLREDVADLGVRLRNFLMRRFFSISGYILPGLCLVIAGTFLQRIAASARDHELMTMDGIGHSITLVAQLFLVGLFAALLTICMRRPFSRYCSAAYILISMSVVLFQPTFIMLASRHIYLPCFMLLFNYTNFLIRPLELLSWMLIFGMGLFFLLASIIKPNQKKI
jgi:hypothetical protein